MKKIIVALLVLGLFSCKPSDSPKGRLAKLEKRIEELEAKLADTYKPGFGELMGGIQAHHAKLWYAGQHGNWKLADFEVHELIEGLESIDKYQKGRKETEKIGMIDPAVEGIQKAVHEENAELFKRNYTALTDACNQCHRETDFEFNIVKVPTETEFSNQGWEMKK